MLLRFSVSLNTPTMGGDAFYLPPLVKNDDNASDTMFNLFLFYDEKHNTKVGDVVYRKPTMNETVKPQLFIFAFRVTE